MNQAETRPPTVRPFDVSHRSVLAIAVPMTLAHLSTPLVGLVDTGVIGQLGDAALIGGIAVGAVVFDIVFTTLNFLRMGTTGLVAQAHGAADDAEVQAIFYRSLLVAFVLGILVLVASQLLIGVSLHLIGGSDAVQEATRTYFAIRVLATPLTLANYVILGRLIGVGRAGLALLAQIVLNGVNIGMSVFFVLGLNYGIEGVAWASVAAEVTAAVFGFFVIGWLSRTVERPRWRYILARAAMLKMFVVNRDIMIRSFLLLFAFGFFTARSAAGGDVALAANQILMNLFFVGAFFLDGMAAAAEQLAGRSLGARYRPAFDRSLKLTIGWGFAISAVLFVIFYAAGPTIIDLMTTNQAVRDAARNLLLFAALTPVAGTLAFQMDGVFIGATWTAAMRNMMILSLAAYLAVWWLLSAPLGITGLWIALLIFLGARGVLLLWQVPARADAAFPA